MKAVLSYIDAQYTEDISLEYLADIAHMNPSYFSFVFKKFNGVSPLRYVANK